MKRAAILCAVFLASCATTADIDRVSMALDKYQESQEKALDKLELAVRDNSEGVMDTAAAIDIAKSEIRAAKEDFTQQVEDVSDEVAARAEGGIDLLAQQGGIAALVAGVAGVALNMHRNRTRKTLVTKVGA